jgi:cytoskeletal protein RodZ
VSELGMRLKIAREEKKITLEQLQNITKIQKRYLEAIEEGNLDILPGHFYARAFVKNYAEAVGLDPEILYEEHASELPLVHKPATEIPARVQTRNKRGTKTTRRFLALLPMVVVVVVVVSIFVGLWVFFQDQDDAVLDNLNPQDQAEQPVEGGRNDDALKPATEGETKEEEEKEEEEKEEEKEEVLVEQELEVVETKGKETVFNLINAEKFTFKVDFQGKSYVGIDNRKGKTFHAATEDGGKMLAFDFSEEETIQFNFGASHNVKLSINEEPFEFPLDIVHQKVTFNFIKAVNGQ